MTNTQGKTSTAVQKFAVRVPLGPRLKNSHCLPSSVCVPGKDLIIIIIIVIIIMIIVHEHKQQSLLEFSQFYPDVSMA